jgi:hypothetical protein
LGWLLLQTKLSVHVIYWFWLCLFCNVHPWLWFNMVNCYIILVIYVFHSKLWFYVFLFIYFYKRQNQWIFVCCNLGSLVNFHDQWIQNESFILTSISPFSFYIHGEIIIRLCTATPIYWYMACIVINFKLCRMKQIKFKLRYYVVLFHIWCNFPLLQIDPIYYVIWFQFRKNELQIFGFQFLFFGDI